LTSEDSNERDTFDTLAYVVGSRYRKMIVSDLSSGPSNPSKIAEERDVHVPHVSRALGELENRDVVSAHASGSRTRLYRLTDHGEEVAELLADYEENDDS